MSRRRPPLAGLIVALVIGVAFAAAAPPLLYAALNHGLHAASASQASQAETAVVTTPAASVTTAGGGTVTTTAPPAAADPGRAEAEAIAALVAKSGGARKQVIDAVNGVSNCSVDPLDGQDAMAAAADTRGQVLDGIAALPKGLPEEGAVVPPLEEAMRQSIDANHAFGAWMDFVIAQGCSGRAPTNADFTEANAASGRATTAKKAFAAAWNPVAARYGLPKVTETDL